MIDPRIPIPGHKKDGETQPIERARRAEALKTGSVSTAGTIQEAKAEDVKVGDLVVVPLAPAKGPITIVPEPVTPTKGEPGSGSEPMVGVVVKQFWASKTGKAIQKILYAIGSSLALILAGTFASVWAQKKSIFAPGAVDWRALEVACEVAAGMILVTAIMAKLKKTDNNVVSS